MTGIYENKSRGLAGIAIVEPARHQTAGGPPYEYVGWGNIGRTKCFVQLVDDTFAGQRLMKIDTFPAANGCELFDGWLHRRPGLRCWHVACGEDEDDRTPLAAAFQCAGRCDCTRRRISPGDALIGNSREARDGDDD
jgi:hypothetical protein